MMAASSRRCRHYGPINATYNVCTLLLCFSLVHCGIAELQAPSSLAPEAKGALLHIRQELALYNVASVLEGKSQLLPWDPGADPCDWVGVNCACSEPSRAACTVTSMNLSAASLGPQYSLYGRLPDVFKEFVRLSVIDVSHQQVSGPVPQSLLSHPTLKAAFLHDNLFTGGVVHENTSLSSSLKVLDVGSNMLAGPIDSRLCSLVTLMLANNPALCGSIPPCLSRSLKHGVLGTGLLNGLGVGRECSIARAQCTGVPLSLPQPIRDSVGVSDGTYCTLDMQAAVTGARSVNITFSPLTNVDALTLSFTGVGLSDMGGWFWMSPTLHSLLKATDAPQEVRILKIA